MNAIAVKICGIKTLDEALAAVESGADLLGFNFYPPSPRYLEPRDCAGVIDGLRKRGLSVSTVGVFVNAPVENVRHILDKCGLDLAQLSGDEPPEAVAALGGRAFKALRPAVGDSALQQSIGYVRLGSPPALLVDAYRPGLYGGSGEKGDWNSARQLAARYPLLLAGGLHPGNVAQAIHAVHPWGVDVASGVESTPGRKDFHKMRAFVRAARELSVEVEGC